MNCSTTSTEHPARYFLTENAGASMFLFIFVGLYGMAFIVYFTCQPITDVRHNEEYRIAREFFFSFDQITERDDIFHRLTDEDWLRKIYSIYYSNEPMQAKLVEAKVNSCMKKYRQKLVKLRCKHAYYVTEIFPPSSVITTV